MKPISTTKTLDNDDAPVLSQADFDRARFRVGGKDASQSEWRDAVQARLGKRRVSIMLDAVVIEYFKAQAGERGYQTLINQALREAMHGAQIEQTIRQAIREELHAA